MNSKFQWIKERFPFGGFLSGWALATGLLIPSLFECLSSGWRTSHYVRLELLAFAIFAATCALCFGWCFCARSLNTEAAHAEQANFQFGLRAIVIVTTLVALVAAFARMLDLDWSGVAVISLALVTIWTTVYQPWAVRFRTLALMAVLFLPGVWLIAFNRPFGHTSGLLKALPFAPAVLPAVLVRRLFDGLGVDHMPLLASGFVICFLIVGGLLARRGGKLWVSFLVGVYISSSVSSLIMHAFYRV